MNTSMNVIALNMKLCIRSFVNIIFVCARPLIQWHKIGFEGHMNVQFHVPLYLKTYVRLHNMWIQLHSHVNILAHAYPHLSIGWCAFGGKRQKQNKEGHLCPFRICTRLGRVWFDVLLAFVLGKIFIGTPFNKKCKKKPHGTWYVITNA